MNVQDRVKEILTGKVYEKGLKNIELNNQETNIIVYSMQKFKGNINPEGFVAKMKLNEVNRLIDNDDYSKLTTSQARTVCEALYDVLEALFFFNIEDEKKNDIEISIYNLFVKMQRYGEYDFLKQLNKCNRRKGKSDIGGDAMELMVNGFKN